MPKYGSNTAVPHRTTESSVYCPGFTDGEDGEGNAIEGAWRTDNEQSSGMEPVQCTSSNRYVISLNALKFIYPSPSLYKAFKVCYLNP